MPTVSTGLRAAIDINPLSLGMPYDPGGGSGFAGYVPLTSQNPHPIIVYSVANYRPHLSHCWANVIVIAAVNLPIFKSLFTRIFLSQKSRKFATPF